MKDKQSNGVLASASVKILRIGFILVATAVLLAVASVAVAWHGPGHERTTELALQALPKDMPEFFRQGGDVVANAAQDPDMFTRPIAPIELSSTESCEHFFDVELLKGMDLPDTRYEYIEECLARGIKPNKVGMLPYAVTEWTQRLTIAFAEHRKWPDDKALQEKCLVYAGLLAHYAEDLNQPLHTTINYDGKVDKPGAASPRSGIHNKVDALLNMTFDSAEILKDLTPAPLYERPATISPSGTTTRRIGTATRPTAAAATASTSAPAVSPLLKAVLAQIDDSHAQVDRVYALENKLPPMDKPGTNDPGVRAFATERIRAATRFTASLYLTAWRDSQFIELPAWHRRGHK